MLTVPAPKAFGATLYLEAVAAEGRHYTVNYNKSTGTLGRAA